MDRQIVKKDCYAVDLTSKNRLKPVEIKIEYQRKILIKFLNELGEFHCVNDIYDLLYKTNILRGKSNEERSGVRNVMTPITSQELSNRLDELVSQECIELRTIHKVRETAQKEIEVKYYGVKGAIINDEVAENYANFVIKCRDSRNFNPKKVCGLNKNEIEFMKNLVYRIICEQKLATTTYIKANRISDLSIDFTMDTVRYFLNILVKEGKVKTKIENGDDLYSKVPKPSPSSPSIF